MSLPSPLLTVPTLVSDGLQFNGLLMGPGTPYLCKKIEGVDKVNVRTGNTSRPQSRGSYVGTNLLDARTITLTLDVGPFTGPVAQVTNLAPNPSFEYDTVNAAPAAWNTPSPSGGTVTGFYVINSWAASGSKALLASASNVPSSQSMYGSTAAGTPAAAGQAWSAQATMYPQLGYTAPQLVLYFYNSSGTVVGSSVVNGTTGSTVQTLTLQNVIAPAGTASVALFWAVVNYSGAAAAVDVFIDAVSLIQAASLSPYFDGDSAGYEWSGTPGNSSSIPIPGFGRYGTAGNTLAAALAALRNATSNEGTTEYPLWVTLPGAGQVCCMARCTKKSVPWDITADLGGLVQGASVQLEATDPYFYSSPTLAPSIGLPTPGGGLTFQPSGHISFPLSFGGGTQANQATLVNVGNVPCYPVLVVNGPCLNPAISNQSIAGNPTLSFNLQLSAGDRLVLDCDMQSAFYYASGTTVGATRLNALVPGSRWFAIQPGSNVVSFNSQDVTQASGTLNVWYASATDSLT